MLMSQGNIWNFRGCTQYYSEYSFLRKTNRDRGDDISAAPATNIWFEFREVEVNRD